MIYFLIHYNLNLLSFKNYDQFLINILGYPQKIKTIENHIGSQFQNKFRNITQLLIWYYFNKKKNPTYLSEKYWVGEGAGLSLPPPSGTPGIGVLALLVDMISLIQDITFE